MFLSSYAIKLMYLYIYYTFKHTRIKNTFYSHSQILSILDVFNAVSYEYFKKPFKLLKIKLFLFNIL